MLRTALSILLVYTFSNAQEVELGIGPGIISYPDYIGSKSNNILILPFPYIRYTNTYFNIDKDGLNTRLFGVKRLSVKLSLSGSLPVNSEDNVLREGMLDIGFTIEVGPNFIFTLYKQDYSTFAFELPIRSALSTNLEHLRYQGLRANPHLQYTYETKNIEFVLRSGIILSNKEYNSYFYNVDKEYTTVRRPYYNSHSGFSGFKNKVGFTYKKDSWILDSSLSYYNINKASFNNSPLVESHNAFYFKTFLAHLFYSSN